MRSHRTPRVVRRARHRVRDPAANARPRRAGLITSLIAYRAACAASTFQFFSTPKTWTNAQSDCESRGGDLASVRSSEENAEAYALTGGVSTWIGYNDKAVEGSWVWTDGYTGDYSNWLSGEPGPPGTDYEDCACYYYLFTEWGYGESWGDLTCTESLAYLCRFPSATAASPIGDGGDDDGGDDDGGGDDSALGIALGVIVPVLVACTVAIIYFIKKNPAAGGDKIPAVAATAVPSTQMTGQPAPVPQPRFDPMTGQPIAPQPRFDPMTGEPIAHTAEVGIVVGTVLKQSPAL